MSALREIEYLRAKAFEYRTRARRLAGPLGLITDLNARAVEFDTLADRLEWNRLRAARLRGKS
jgi:hypothetical protein